MKKSVIAAASAALVATLVALVLPDVRRYLRIRNM